MKLSKYIFIPQLIKVHWLTWVSRRSVARAMNWSVCEMLFLKLLPQFSSNAHETCYIWFVWCVDVHDLLVWDMAKFCLEWCPFFKTLNTCITIYLCFVFCDKARIGVIYSSQPVITLAETGKKFHVYR